MKKFENVEEVLENYRLRWNMLYFDINHIHRMLMLKWQWGIFQADYVREYMEKKCNIIVSKQNFYKFEQALVYFFGKDSDI